MTKWKKHKPQKTKSSFSNLVFLTFRFLKTLTCSRFLKVASNGFTLATKGSISRFPRPLNGACRDALVLTTIFLFKKTTAMKNFCHLSWNNSSAPAQVRAAVSTSTWDSMEGGQYRQHLLHRGEISENQSFLHILNLSWKQIIGISDTPLLQMTPYFLLGFGP